MDSWVEFVENNTGSTELDADEFNFGAMLTERASTGIPQRYLQRLLPLWKLETRTRREPEISERKRTFCWRRHG